MIEENMINVFEKEVECLYKGETYSVRDNGAVLRHSRRDKKPRPTDNVWTYGKYNGETGYAVIAGEIVHRIVATAFHGEAPSPQHVVDHIDTNRRNNRPENLRWITKLENILFNPITVKKIEFHCGSIENFLKDPSMLRQVSSDPNFEWMRAVSKEEAAASLERLQIWAKSDKQLSGGSLGEWIYKRRFIQRNVEIKRKDNETPNETIQTLSDKIVEPTQKALKPKQVRVPKANPFGFQRDEGVVKYRTTGELFELLKRLLEHEKQLKLPDIVLATAGKGIIVKESWTEKILDIEYSYKSKARIPQYIILHCKDSLITLVIRMKLSADEQEIIRLKNEGFDIVEIDLSWAKDGVTDAEMTYILQKDITKKKWIRHGLIEKAKERLKSVCEPICGAGEGVLHSYVACQRTSNSVQDIDCWYCNYRIDSESKINDESCIVGACFGKSGVETYQDLLSIINVEKDDEQIIMITYNNNGETITKRFDKEVQLPGKTIVQLWDERVGDKLAVRNIYSDWYALIEEDPKTSIKENGQVYAKLGRTVEELENCTTRSIFSFDNSCWETVKQI